MTDRTPRTGEARQETARRFFDRAWPRLLVPARARSASLFQIRVAACGRTAAGGRVAWVRRAVGDGTRWPWPRARPHTEQAFGGKVPLDRGRIGPAEWRTEGVESDPPSQRGSSSPGAASRGRVPAESDTLLIRFYLGRSLIKCDPVGQQAARTQAGLSSPGLAAQLAFEDPAPR